jgi:hypothetical protein
MSTPDARNVRGATIDELVVADDPQRWESLGFAISSGACQLRAVRIRLAGLEAGEGIVGWSLRGVASMALDGLPTTVSRAPPPAAAPPHPNGVVAIDHVVAVTLDLERTIAALQAVGLALRRIRELPSATGAPRQAFFRLGAEILEVVQQPGDGADRAGPARLWGLALVTSDLERSVAALGHNVSAIRPAVQRGRRIASLRRSAGLAIPVALISPEPGGRPD